MPAFFNISLKIMNESLSDSRLQRLYCIVLISYPTLAQPLMMVKWPDGKNASVQAGMVINQGNSRGRYGLIANKYCIKSRL